MFQEKLQSLVLQLTEECSRLRLAHQEKLSVLQAKLQAQNSSQTYSTVEELTECRRHSCGDIQQYLQGGLKALEERCNRAHCYHVISSKPALRNFLNAVITFIRDLICSVSPHISFDLKIIN